MVEEISHDELKQLIDEIVEGDHADETLTSGKVLRQLGGKLRTPFGERKREIERMAEEAVERKLRTSGQDE